MIQCPRFGMHNTLVGARAGFTFAEDFGLGVDRIPGVDRHRKLHVGPTQIGHDLAKGFGRQCGDDTDQERLANKLFPTVDFFIIDRIYIAHG